MDEKAMAKWLEAKENGKAFFTKYGWGILEQRPLPEVIRKYAASDTPFLSALHDTFASRFKYVAKVLQTTPEELLQMVDDRTIY
jgi:hypothetical protein